MKPCRLRRLRAYIGLSQSELAKVAGVSFNKKYNQIKVVDGFKLVPHTSEYYIVR